MEVGPMFEFHRLVILCLFETMNILPLILNVNIRYIKK